jgi:glucose/arabinose dehydrogenase
MDLSRRSRAALLAVAGSVVLAASAQAADGPPPPPKAANGNTVETVATGVPTPTAFAFAGSTVFAGSGPDESGKSPGGLFTLADGKATKVPGTPPVVFGLAYHGGKLYLSAGPKLYAYSGWDGTKFASSKTIYSGKKGFAGFNGIAFGPDGRLYAGLSLAGDKYDHKNNPDPLSQGVVSMTASGKDLKLVAKGLRQPFQLVFPKGAKYPYVSDLAQDGTKQIPLDQIVQAKPGEDYGFATCVRLTTTSCATYDKPAVLLPKHSSPMGIGAIGRTLYVSLFAGLDGKHPVIATVPTTGGKPKPFLTGFVAPVIGLGINAGTVYVGDLTGTIYKVAA